MTLATSTALAEECCGVVELWPSAPRSVGGVRSCLAEFLVGRGLPQLTEAAELIVSELFTNAVAHAVPLCGDVIATRFEVVPEGVRIEVHDGSGRRPEPRQAAAYAQSGRGLAVVDALTGGRWGVADRQGPGKLVWAVCAGDGAGVSG